MTKKEVAIFPLYSGRLLEAAFLAFYYQVKVRCGKRSRVAVARAWRARVALTLTRQDPMEGARGVGGVDSRRWCEPHQSLSAVAYLGQHVRPTCHRHVRPVSERSKRTQCGGNGALSKVLDFTCPTEDGGRGKEVLKGF